MCPPLSCPVRSFGEEIVTPCCCWPSGGRALGHRRLGDLGYRTQRRGSRAETVPHATSQAATMTDASCRGRAQPHTHTLPPLNIPASPAYGAYTTPYACRLQRPDSNSMRACNCSPQAFRQFVTGAGVITGFCTPPPPSGLLQRRMHDQDCENATSSLGIGMKTNKNHANGRALCLH